MKTLTSLFILAASAIITPVAGTSSPGHFRLKSIGATNQEHNNLYVYAYHTGAGLNDAVLTKDVNTASSVYLNGTNAFFDFNTELLWGVVATGDNKYTCECLPLESCVLILIRANENSTAWERILINAGQGSNVFSAEGSSFIWSEASGFGGWLGKTPSSLLFSRSDLVLTFRSLQLVPQCAPAVLFEPQLQRHYPLQLQQDPTEGRVHQLALVELGLTAFYSPIYCLMAYLLLVCSEFEGK